MNEDWKERFANTFPDGLYDCLPDTTLGENHLPFNQFERVKAFIAIERELIRKETLEEVEKVVPMKRHLVDCIALEDGYGHAFKDCSQHCQANGWNACRDALFLAIKSLVEKKQ